MALASQTIRNQNSARAYSSQSFGGRRRRKRNIAIAAAVVLAAGAAITLWWTGGDDNPSAATPPQVTPAPVEPRAERPQERIAQQPARKPAPEQRRTAAADAAPKEALPDPAARTLAATNEREPTELTMSRNAPPTGAPVPTRDPMRDQARDNQPASSPGGPPAQPAVVPPPSQPQAQPEAQPATQPAPQPAPQPAMSALAASIERGRQLVAQNRPVQAREALNRLLSDPGATSDERDQVRRLLAEVSQTLTFGPVVVEGDPFAFKYEIKSGDSLVRIASRENLGVDWRFLQRINRMSDPGRLQVGQKIKAVRGPFHAVVSKGAFRLDLYQGSPPTLSGETVVNAAGGATVFIASFPVGLGEFGSTPIGAFMVKQNSRLVNPAWRNPRTGEQFTADDPKNPIGERWVGLEGIEERTRNLLGYGLHGTIEPESIGTEKSMGCVRMLHDDIALIYELMTEGASTVQIVP